MSQLHKQCADCGHSFKAVNKQQLYCKVCRVFRNLVYISSKTQKCYSCGDRFAPLSRNERLCSKCDVTQKQDVTGTCRFCRAENVVLYHPDIRVCTACMRSREKRDKLIEVIAKARMKRIKED